MRKNIGLSIVLVLLVALVVSCGGTTPGSGCPTPIGGGPTPVSCDNTTSGSGCPTPIGGGPTPVSCGLVAPSGSGCPTPIGGGPTPVSCGPVAPSGSGCPSPVPSGPTPVSCGPVAPSGSGCPSPVPSGPTPVSCGNTTSGSGCPTPIGGGPTPVSCGNTTSGSGCPTPIGGGPTPVSCSASGEALTFIPSFNANCRFGSNLAFAPVGVAMKGQPYQMDGRNRSSTWYRIMLSASLGCWVSADTGMPSGDTGGLRVLADLPTPTPTFTPTPTITPTPLPYCSNFDQRECIAHQNVCNWSPRGVCVNK